MYRSERGRKVVEGDHYMVGGLVVVAMADRSMMTDYAALELVRIDVVRLLNARRFRLVLIHWNVVVVLVVVEDELNEAQRSYTVTLGCQVVRLWLEVVLALWIRWIGSAKQLSSRYNLDIRSHLVDSCYLLLISLRCYIARAYSHVGRPSSHFFLRLRHVIQPVLVLLLKFLFLFAICTTGPPGRAGGVPVLSIT